MTHGRMGRLNDKEYDIQFDSILNIGSIVWTKVECKCAFKGKFFQIKGVCF